MAPSRFVACARRCDSAWWSLLQASSVLWRIRYWVLEEQTTTVSRNVGEHHQMTQRHIPENTKVSCNLWMFG